MKKLISIILTIFLFAPEAAFAHQPRIPEGNQITIENPEVSKAYYTQLKGVEQHYLISSEKTFDLYVNILTPDIDGQEKDLSAKIIKDGNITEPLAVLDGKSFTWTPFFEPFGYDSYWAGPEYDGEVGAGNYEIIISSPDNNSKYSLATGKQELFDFKETVNALTLIPKIKRDFFGKSPIDFILSPFGWGLILVMFILAFIFGFVYRLILRKFATSTVRTVTHNIGMKDRLLRLALAVGLFVWAITTSWSPLLLFFSGFTFFEAIFSWCGLYAALGRNSCPI